MPPKIPEPEKSPIRKGASSNVFASELKHQRFDSARENIIGNSALSSGEETLPKKKGIF
jgi:hypothetical protein